MSALERFVRSGQHLPANFLLLLAWPGPLKYRASRTGSHFNFACIAPYINNSNSEHLIPSQTLVASTPAPRPMAACAVHTRVHRSCLENLINEVNRLSGLPVGLPKTCNLQRHFLCSCGPKKDAYVRAHACQASAAARWALVSGNRRFLPKGELGCSCPFSSCPRAAPCF